MRDTNGKLIADCDVSVETEDLTADIVQANARLIADAPRLYDENIALKQSNAELLEVLKRVTEEYSFDSLGPGVKLQIVNAIAKAEGAK